MGTEVAVSFSALRAQLETERSSLYKIDENIKKIVQTGGRFTNDRFNTSSAEYARGGPRLGSRNLYQDTGNSYKNDDHLLGKRKHETKTVFSRLSARAHDSDGEDDGPGPKRTRMPSAVSRELPTRAAVLRAQGDDEQARKRNRRIFGSLLGTLQKFKQEEIVLQTKEEKKAQVERKIEEQARLEKEREQRERKSLFAEREYKKATIKALEAKMARVQEFEKWEESQKNLGNFILTKAKPHIYWLPKKMTSKANEKLNSSRKYHEKCMTKKRQELQEELQRIEQRCLRPRGPGAKENDPQPTHESKDSEQKRPPRTESESSEVKEEGSRKRDKFAMDVDQKEDSDGEERHSDLMAEKEKDTIKVNINKQDMEEETDTTIENENNTTMEQENNTTMEQENNTTMEQENNTTMEQENNTTMEQENNTIMEQENNTTKEQENNTTEEQENNTTKEQETETTMEEKGTDTKVEKENDTTIEEEKTTVEADVSQEIDQSLAASGDSESGTKRAPASADDKPEDSDHS